MSDFLTLDAIIKAANIRETELEVPEWGGKLLIREMTAEARDKYEQSLFTANEKGQFERNLENARAKLIAACVYGQDGKPLIKTEQHIKLIGNMPASIIDRIFAKCQEINAISAEDLEEIAGN